MIVSIVNILKLDSSVDINHPMSASVTSEPSSLSKSSASTSQSARFCPHCRPKPENHSLCSSISRDLPWFCGATHSSHDPPVPNDPEAMADQAPNDNNNAAAPPAVAPPAVVPFVDHTLVHTQNLYDEMPNLASTTMVSSPYFTRNLGIFHLRNTGQPTIMVDHFFHPTNGSHFFINEPENHFARHVFESIAALQSTPNHQLNPSQSCAQVITTLVTSVNRDMGHATQACTQRERTCIRSVLLAFNDPTPRGNARLAMLTERYCNIRLGRVPFYGDELDAALFACSEWFYATHNERNLNGGGWAMLIALMLHSHMLHFAHVTPPRICLHQAQLLQLAAIRRPNTVIRYSSAPNHPLVCVESRQPVIDQMEAYLARRNLNPPGHFVVHTRHPVTNARTPVPLVFGIQAYGNASTLESRRWFN